MVENFTPIKEETYADDVKVLDTEIENEFELNIKHSIKRLAKEPSQNTIDNILNYSKSLSKK